MKHRLPSFLVIGALVTAFAANAVFATDDEPLLIAMPPEPADVVAPTAPPRVEAFDLADVHLLDSPFLTAMHRNGEYLLLLKSDRFLHYFRTEAGLNAKAEAYPGWESPNEGAGRCLGHYLSALSLQYRASHDQRFRDRALYIVGELAECQKANGNGMLCAEAHSKQFWEDLAAGNADALKKKRVPWYIQHKMFAGLGDAYRLSDVKQAKEILLRLSNWAIEVTQKLSDAQFQSMLDQEHGGMCEVLADVYAMTGDMKYLKLAERFEHHAVIDPLMHGKDALAGLHANTQIPKVTGLARLYELTNAPKNRLAAEFFWHTVVQYHTYANGGNSDDERFDPPNQLGSHLRLHTSETCNTYNMLKLTNHLIEWNPQAEYADYEERALFNHILASIGPKPGNYAYYTAMKPGHYPVYSSPAESFWCCVGTGMENHAKYAEAIYFHHETDLYVNQFIPSELNWREHGMKLRLETRYPRDGMVRITIQGDQPTTAKINLRVPAWASSRIELRINGNLVENLRPRQYVSISRFWMPGDSIEYTLPMELRTEALQDDPHRVAIFYGPLLLAGKLNSLTSEHQLLADSPASSGDDPTIPALGVIGRHIDDWLVAVPGEGLRFRTVNVGLDSELMLVPFNQISHDRYTIYWNLTDRAGGNR